MNEPIEAGSGKKKKRRKSLGEVFDFGEYPKDHILELDYLDKLQKYDLGTVNPYKEKEVIKSHKDMMRDGKDRYQSGWIGNENFLKQLSPNWPFVRVDKFIDKYFEGANYEVLRGKDDDTMGNFVEIGFCNIPRFMDIEIAYLRLPNIKGTYYPYYIVSESFIENYTFNILFKNEENKDTFGLLVPLTKEDRRMPDYSNFKEDIQGQKNADYFNSLYAHILQVRYGKSGYKEQWPIDGYFDHETFEEGLLKAINKHNKHIGRSVVTTYLDMWDEDLTFRDKWGSWHIREELVNDLKK